METRGKKRKNAGPIRKLKQNASLSQSARFPDNTLDDGSGSSSNADPMLEDSKSGEAGHESKNLLLEKKF